MVEKSIKATIKAELATWRAPNFARRITDGADEGQGSIPVRELDDSALEGLAMAWLEDLYRIAGRRYCPFRRPVRDNPE